MTCAHPPARLFSWFAIDGTLCVCCCDCGSVLRGGASIDREKAADDKAAKMHRDYVAAKKAEEK